MEGKSKEFEETSEIYVWGSDEFSQLGLEDTKSRKSYNIPQTLSLKFAIKMISCGEDHSAFLSNNGELFTLGSNHSGRLGIGNRTIFQVNNPLLVGSLKEIFITLVSCGWAHTCAIGSSGELYTWGLGENGNLGIGTSESQYSPVKLKFPDSNIFVTSLSCGRKHTAIVDRLGRIYAWGNGEVGQLGTGIRETKLTPCLITSLKEEIAFVSCGIFHTLFLTKKGNVYATGGNNFGQLGNGNKKSTLSPTKINDLDSESISKIKASYFSIALSEKGEIFIWGTLPCGEFLTPKKMLINNPITDFDIGHSFAILLDIQGKCYSFGSNTKGELGLGDFKSRDYPSVIKSLENKLIMNVSCGSFFSMALSKNYSTFPHFSMEIQELQGVREAREFYKTNSPNRAFNLKLEAVELKNLASEFSANGTKDLNLNAEKECRDENNSVIKYKMGQLENSKNLSKNSLELDLKMVGLSPINNYRRDHSAFDTQGSRILENSPDKMFDNNILFQDSKDQKVLRNSGNERNILNLKNAKFNSDEKNKRYELEMKEKELEKMISNYNHLNNLQNLQNLQNVQNLQKNNNLNTNNPKKDNLRGYNNTNTNINIKKDYEAEGEVEVEVEAKMNKDKIKYMGEEIELLRNKLIEVTQNFETMDLAIKRTENENLNLKKEISRLKLKLKLKNDNQVNEESVSMIEGNKIQEIMKEYEQRLMKEIQTKNKIMIEKTLEGNNFKEIIADLESKLISKQEELSNLEESSAIRLKFLEESEASNYKIIKCNEDEIYKLKETTKILEERIFSLNQSNIALNNEINSISSDRDILAQSLKAEKEQRQIFENLFTQEKAKKQIFNQGSDPTKYLNLNLMDHNEDAIRNQVIANANPPILSNFSNLPRNHTNDAKTELQSNIIQNIENGNEDLRSNLNLNLNSNLNAQKMNDYKIPFNNNYSSNNNSNQAKQDGKENREEHESDNNKILKLYQNLNLNLIKHNNDPEVNENVNFNLFPKPNIGNFLIENNQITNSQKMELNNNDLKSDGPKLKSEYYKSKNESSNVNNLFYKNNLNTNKDTKSSLVNELELALAFKKSQILSGSKQLDGYNNSFLFLSGKANDKNQIEMLRKINKSDGKSYNEINPPPQWANQKTAEKILPTSIDLGESLIKVELDKLKSDFLSLDKSRMEIINKELHTKIPK